MKWINDIEPLYDKGLEEKEEIFVCPVCKKEYKRRSSADKHINKRDCHTYYQLLKDTLTEELMYKLYTSILNELNNNSRVSISSFRKKTRIYNALARYVTYTKKHKLTNRHVIDYFLYIYFYKKNNIVQAANIASDNKLLKEFRSFLIKNESLIDSESFFNTYKEQLEGDTSFTIRSVERAELSLQYVMEHMGESFWGSLSSFEQDRVQEVMNVIEGKQDGL